MDTSTRWLDGMVWIVVPALWMVAVPLAAQPREEEACQDAIASAQPVVAAPVRHLPVNQVLAGAPAVFRFRDAAIGPDDALVVRWRARGSERLHEARAERTAEGWQAEIPADTLPPNGFTYWVVHRRGGTERALFASADSPHPVHVQEPEPVAHERAMLERRGGRRSLAVLRGEWVDLGTREVAGEGAHAERYYQLEASYAYFFFTTVDRIELGLGRLRGNVADSADLEGDDERGLDYGRAEITWRIHPLVRLRSGVLFGFSHEGFELGGSGALVLGHPDATHLTVGIEGVTTLGATGLVRLGWLTIPRLPMGATVEVTTWPGGDQVGVRLLYDIAYRIYPGAEVRVEAGYRGWNSIEGGPSLGAELALAF